MKTLADLGITEGAVTALIILYILLFSVAVICALILFYLKGFGIYKMSRKLSIKRSWHGFIPLVNVYSFGKLADYSANEKSIPLKKPLTFFFVASRITAVVAFFTALSFLVKLFFAADLAVFNGEELDPIIFSDLSTVGFISIGSVLFYIVYLIINTVCAVRIYRRFNVSAAALKGVLGLIFPILLPCFVYSFCKNDPIENKRVEYDDETAVFRIDG